MAQPIPTEVGEQHLTASIGVAFYPGDGDTGPALIQAADLAMYRAKALGKNRYHLAGDYTAPKPKPNRV
ncbi:MAG: hypothetical protein AUJ55_02100 [Proteobacteria bacterium CG1_02_64_396]|nr:MAG: hypothetical protein AUJ55_02100 [Proteobacteria bacterium CG1_02_64_396]